ncbi:MAG: glycosyltransferase family 39 protein [Anaerolineales bacterium]|nr:glycosyltransferase family 39 protein [Anaerolineales bacterium]
MKETPSFFTSRKAWITALVVIFVLGLSIRFYDANDLPLEFHSTRQMLSVLKARGMYYDTRPGVTRAERTFAIQQWKLRASIEPEIMERIVAFTYRYTGEQHWVARAYSSIFWIIGGFFLFLLARRLTSTDGALAATAFYLFLPYAVIASRSFQPDPLMVMFIILFWWAVYEWEGALFAEKSSKRSWLFAVLAGLFGGLAIFVKFVAAFFVIGGGVGALLLGRKPLTEVLKQPQAYVMSVLGILPGAAYAVYGVWVAGYLGQQFGGRFIPAYFLSPAYYLGWVNMLNLVIGGIPLMLALFGLFFFDDGKRRFMLALWAGYVVFGIFFNYHIASHDYYSLPLIPIAALSLAPLAELLFSKLAQLTAARLLRLSAVCILILGVFASLWGTRTQLNSVDYRPEAQMWAEISQTVDGYTIAGLTQDYGSRMAYWGWKYITSWPTYGDLLYRDDLLGGQRDFEKQFATIVAKKDLFVVTDFADLNRQPFLKEKLKEFPVFAQGDGYIIYDLMEDSE